MEGQGQQPSSSGYGQVGVDTCGRRQLYAHVSVQAWVDVCSLQVHSLHSPCQSLGDRAPRVRSSWHS